jgi:hypothetical protein
LPAIASSSYGAPSQVVWLLPTKVWSLVTGWLELPS